MYCTQCSYNNDLTAKYCKNCDLDLSLDSIDTGHTEVLIYAGFWVRFLAALLDFFLMGAAVLALLLVLAGMIVISGRDNIIHNQLAMSIFFTIFICFAIVYYVFTSSSDECATLGKRWMNIKVLDIHGNKITPKHALGRLLARSLSYLSLYTGFLIQPFTTRKQALHDLLARTIVVRANENTKISIKATFLVLFIALMVPLLALFSTAGIPAFKQYIQKIQLEKGIQLGEKATAAVTRYYLNNNRLPAVISEADRYLSTTTHVSAIDINPLNGELTLTFSDAERLGLRNKHLIYTATFDTVQHIIWKCHSNDIESQLLPASCR
jgi:uncharacterized RDD family membrane protein YckC